jgi:hypothetical protein
MKFMRLVLALSPAIPLAADQANQPHDVAMAYVPGNPLMQLPGMKPALSTNSQVSQAALPEPVITDVSNAPNPFDSRKGGALGQTQILYTLSKDAAVRVTLYDLLGFRVRRWDFPAGQNGGRTGHNNFAWDGTNEAGQKVSKGGYLAQIEIETPETIVTVVRKIGVIH